MRILVLATTFATLALTGAGRTLAQSVSGTLTDQTTGQPLAGATVRLLDPAGERVATGASDRAGRWVVRAPAMGVLYRIQVERVGYARIETDPFTVGAEPMRMALATRPEIVMLEGITPQVLNHMALLSRSTTRKSARTLLPADVAARVARIRPGSTGQLVRNMIAGLGLTWDDWPHFGSVPLTNGQTASRGLTFSGQADFRSPWERSAATSARRQCDAVVAVDGIPYVKNRLVFNLERLVPLPKVRAVEIFPDPDFLPRELDLIDKLPALDRAPPPAHPIPCGVVAIWTREGLGIP